MQENTIIVRVGSVGDPDVGKKSIINRYIFDKFEQYVTPFIGQDFFTKELTINNKIVKLQLHHTGGQNMYDRKFAMLSRAKYYHVVLYLFDVTNSQSFAKIPEYINEVRPRKDMTQIRFLVGNKIDLTDERVVSYEEAQHFAEQNQMPYFEISTKDNTNVDHMFESVAEMSLNDQLARRAEEERQQKEAEQRSKEKAEKCRI